MQQGVRRGLLGRWAPTTVGRYELRERIGEGAMGQVYRAHDPGLQRLVAIKLLRPLPPGSDDDGLREARMVARLQHPHVINVFDCGVDRGVPYVVMELVDGDDLDRWIARSRRSWSEVVEVFAQAALGLAAAHGAQMVHRDFKPSNVLLGRDGRVRVGDFGLAKAVATPGGGPEASAPRPPGGAPSSRASGVVGTIGYMAPEVMEGYPATAASDQFSFCATLHRALYGYGPLDPEPEHDRGGEGPIPAVPRALEALVFGGLAARPEERHASMGALARALRQLVVQPGLASCGRAVASTGEPRSSAALPHDVIEISNRPGATSSAPMNGQDQGGELPWSLVRTRGWTPI